MPESLAIIASWGHPDCVRFLEGLKNFENWTLFTVKSGFQILLTSFHCNCNGKNLKALWERRKILQNLSGNEYTLLGAYFILLDVHCVNEGIFWDFFFLNEPSPWHWSLTLVILQVSCDITPLHHLRNHLNILKNWELNIKHFCVISCLCICFNRLYSEE